MDISVDIHGSGLASATLTGTMAGVQYLIEWGDGSPPRTVTDLSGSPAATHTYLSGTYQVTASGTDGSTAAATVDWGDGSPVSTGRTFSNSIPHTYPANGIYTVVLTDTADPTSVAWIQWTVNDL